MAVYGRKEWIFPQTGRNLCDIYVRIARVEHRGTNDRDAQTHTLHSPMKALTSGRDDGHGSARVRSDLERRLEEFTN